MKRTQVITNLREARTPKPEGEVIISMHEDIAAIKENLVEMARLLNQMMDVVNVHGAAVLKLKSATDRKAEQLNIRVGADPNISGEADEQ